MIELKKARTRLRKYAKHTHMQQQICGRRGIKELESVISPPILRGSDVNDLPYDRRKVALKV